MLLVLWCTFTYKDKKVRKVRNKNTLIFQKVKGLHVPRSFEFCFHLNHFHIWTSGAILLIDFTVPQQVINFFVGLLFLPLLDQLGAEILYSIFASFCLVAVLFVKSSVLETKGKSLQEIEIALLPSE